MWCATGNPKGCATDNPKGCATDIPTGCATNVLYDAPLLLILGISFCISGICTGYKIQYITEYKQHIIQFITLVSEFEIANKVQILDKFRSRDRVASLSSHYKVDII